MDEETTYTLSMIRPYDYNKPAEKPKPAKPTYRVEAKRAYKVFAVKANGKLVCAREATSEESWGKHYYFDESYPSHNQAEEAVIKYITNNQYSSYEFVVLKSFRKDYIYE